MAKAKLVHYDILGKEIVVGNIVAAYKHSMRVCRVTRLMPKMIEVESILNKNFLFNCYPGDTAKLDDEYTIAYILKMENNEDDTFDKLRLDPLDWEILMLHNILRQISHELSGQHPDLPEEIEED